MNSNSHTNKGKEQLQNIKTWTNWQSSCFSNIDGTFVVISSILFDSQTLELISQSLQPSQNRAKDPRGTPEHGTSTFLRRRSWNLNLSSWIGEVVLHKNPTCGVEAELGIQIPTEATLGLDNIGKIELHNGPHYSPKSSANIAITKKYLFNPVHKLIK